MSPVIVPHSSADISSLPGNRKTLDIASSHVWLGRVQVHLQSFDIQAKVVLPFRTQRPQSSMPWCQGTSPLMAARNFVWRLSCGKPFIWKTAVRIWAEHLFTISARSIIRAMEANHTSSGNTMEPRSANFMLGEGRFINVLKIST